MIISRTPYRISFFGGGTDYPEYYLKHGGKVLGVAIDKYSYLNVRKLPPFFEHKHRIVYSRQENVCNLEDIQHPSVRNCLKFMDIKDGISIHHDGDIPARSGMGSSSSFTVGLLNSLYAMRGKRVSQSDLLSQALYVEQDMIAENVGSQDQTFAVYGGLNIIEFRQDSNIVVKPILINHQRLNHFQSNIMLIFSGLSRFSSEVAKEQKQRINENLAHLDNMKSLVSEAQNILESDRDLREFGELLNYTWELKKKLSSQITNPLVDEIYSTAMKNGALGGKLLGAGGGGFLAFFVEPDKQNAVRESLSSFLHIPISFDFDGTKIIVYKPWEGEM
jgi:D-glycero-alpha-D-manno-heptose-7-phosphate kinase